MKANSRSLYFLCTLFACLLFFSIFIVLNTQEKPENVEYLKEGYIKFKDSISFPLDIQNDVEPMDYIDEIVNESGSKFDSIQSISFKVDNIGMHRGDITFKYKDIITSRSFSYSVIDSEVPVLYLDKPIVVKQGSKLNLEEFVSVKDNSLKEDEKLVARVLGGFDTSKIGVFKVVIEANDESGNQASFATTITVTNSEGNLGVTNQESRPVVNSPQPVDPPLVNPPIGDNSSGNTGEDGSNSGGNTEGNPPQGESDE